MDINKITKENIEDIVGQYDIKYMNMTGKGVINYEHNYIGINPMVNEDVDTIAHEIIHHYTDKVLGIECSEDDTEYYAQEMLKNSPEIKKYISEITIDTYLLNCPFSEIPVNQYGCKR